MSLPQKRKRGRPRKEPRTDESEIKVPESEPKPKEVRTSQRLQSKQESCKDCGKTLNSKASKQRHELLHSGQRPFACGVCGEQFKRLEELHKHESTHEADAKICCYICHENFENEDDLVTHLQTHDINITPHVSSAGYTFRSSGVVKQYQELYGTGAILPCYVCFKEFGSAEELLNHLAVHSALELMKGSSDRNLWKDSTGFADAEYSKWRRKKSLSTSAGAKSETNSDQRFTEVCRVCHQMFLSVEDLLDHWLKKRGRWSHEGPIGKEGSNSRVLSVVNKCKIRCEKCEVVMESASEGEQHLRSHQKGEGHLETKSDEEDGDRKSVVESSEKKVDDRKSVMESGDERIGDGKSVMASGDERIGDGKSVMASDKDYLENSGSESQDKADGDLFKSDVGKKDEKLDESENSHIEKNQSGISEGEKTDNGQSRNNENSGQGDFHIEDMDIRSDGEVEGEISEVDQTEDGKFKCSTCKKTFLDSQLFRSHMAEHTPMKVFRCPMCGKYYARPEDLKQHVVRHVSQLYRLGNATDSSDFRCDLCAEMFKNEKDLQFHSVFHGVYKPGNRRTREGHSTVCPICGKVLQKATSLFTHIKLHSQGRDFLCNVCGKAFRSINNKERHEKIHTGVKDFECEVCGKGLSRKAEYVAHVARHERDPSFNGKAGRKRGTKLIGKKVVFAKDFFNEEGAVYKIPSFARDSSDIYVEPEKSIINYKKKRKVKVNVKSEEYQGEVTLSSQTVETQTETDTAPNTLMSVGTITSGDIDRPQGVDRSQGVDRQQGVYRPVVAGVEDSQETGTDEESVIIIVQDPNTGENEVLTIKGFQEGQSKLISPNDEIIKALEMFQKNENIDELLTVPGTDVDALTQDQLANIQPAGSQEVAAGLQEEVAVASQEVDTAATVVYMTEEQAAAFADSADLGTDVVEVKQEPGVNVDETPAVNSNDQSRVKVVSFTLDELTGTLTAVYEDDVESKTTQARRGDISESNSMMQVHGDVAMDTDIVIKTESTDKFGENSPIKTNIMVTDVDSHLTAVEALMQMKSPEQRIKTQVTEQLLGSPEKSSGSLHYASGNSQSPQKVISGNQKVVGVSIPPNISRIKVATHGSSLLSSSAERTVNKGSVKSEASDAVVEGLSAGSAGFASSPAKTERVKVLPVHSEPLGLPLKPVTLRDDIVVKESLLESHCETPLRLEQGAVKAEEKGDLEESPGAIGQVTTQEAAESDAPFDAEEEDDDWEPQAAHRRRRRVKKIKTEPSEPVRKSLRKNSYEGVSKIVASLVRPRKPRTGTSEALSEPDTTVKMSKFVKCNICKVNMPQDVLRSHIGEMHGEKAYVCGICCQGFTTDVDLHMHLISHEKEDRVKTTLCLLVEDAGTKNLKEKGSQVLSGATSAAILALERGGDLEATLATVEVDDAGIMINQKSGTESDFNLRTAVSSPTKDRSLSKKPAMSQTTTNEQSHEIIKSPIKGQVLTENQKSGTHGSETPTKCSQETAAKSSVSVVTPSPHRTRASLRLKAEHSVKSPSPSSQTDTAEKSQKLRQRTVSEKGECQDKDGAVTESSSEASTSCVACRDSFMSSFQLQKQTTGQDKSKEHTCQKIPDEETEIQDQKKEQKLVRGQKHSSSNKYVLRTSSKILDEETEAEEQEQKMEEEQKEEEEEEEEEGEQDSVHEEVSRTSSKCVCGLCSRRFSNVTQLTRHVNTHYKEKSFSCSACQKSYGRIDELQKHFRSHEEDDDNGQRKTRMKFLPKNSVGMFPCHLCEDQFSTYRERYSHVQTHKKRKSKEDDSATKNDSDSDPNNLVCKICNLTLSSLRHLRRHKLVHSDEKMFLCQECGKSFLRSDDLKAHSKRQHTMSKLSEDEEESNASFSRSCPFCQKKFKSYKSFRNHVRTHKSEKLDGSLKCEVCDKVFIKHISLRNHMQKHKDTYRRGLKRLINKPTNEVFDCKCGKQIRNKSNFLRHMKLHNEGKNFFCSFCQKGFSRAADLKMHERIHTGERPFLCNICGKGFTSNSALGHHVKSHDQPFVYKFSCSQCEVLFSTRKEFNDHVKSCTPKTLEIVFIEGMETVPVEEIEYS